jgi:transposase-like protein
MVGRAAAASMFLMPWKCPACQESIRHNEREVRPRARVTYRCHVCRLELQLDPQTDTLALAPPRDHTPEQKLRETA